MCGSEVVGIITRSNLMRAMVSMARVAPAPVSAENDSAIREQMLAIMQKEEWAPVATTNVVVRDGVVELWGVIIDERQRAALKVAAENIPGVKAVKDHMAWIEPVSGMTISDRRMKRPTRWPAKQLSTEGTNDRADEEDISHIGGLTLSGRRSGALPRPLGKVSGARLLFSVFIL